MYLDVEIGIGIYVLDFVNSRLQSPVLEDGSIVAGRVCGHGEQGKLDNVGNTSNLSPGFIHRHQPHISQEGITVSPVFVYNQNAAA